MASKPKGSLREMFTDQNRRRSTEASTKYITLNALIYFANFLLSQLLPVLSPVSTVLFFPFSNSDTIVSVVSVKAVHDETGGGDENIESADGVADEDEDDNSEAVAGNESDASVVSSVVSVSDVSLNGLKIGRLIDRYVERSID